MHKELASGILDATDEGGTWRQGKELIRNLRNDPLHKSGDTPEAALCRLRAANAIEHLVSDLQELHNEHTCMRFSGAVQIQGLQNELAAKDRQIERLKRTRDAAIA